MRGMRKRRVNLPNRVAYHQTFSVLLLALQLFAVGAVNSAPCDRVLPSEPVLADREALWPEGKMPHAQAHQCVPSIEWYDKPEHPNGACMILVSGGAYESCSDIALLKTWRIEFTSLGYQTVNLDYRTPRPKGLPVYQSAWEDAQRAVRLVRSEAAARGFDPEKIGVIGMSAGGHLTCLMAFSSQTPAYGKVDALDEISPHVNWAVADAPAYATRRSEDGTSPEGEGLTLTPELSKVFRFDARTCPVAFHHGGADDLATPNGSSLMYRRLREMGIPAELHLYANQYHNAFGLDEAVAFVDRMSANVPIAAGSARTGAEASLAAVAEWEKLRADGIQRNLHTRIERTADGWAERVTENLTPYKPDPRRRAPFFVEIPPRDILPSYRRAIAAERMEIREICGDSAAPDFSNTVRRLTLAGAAVDRVRLMMVNYKAANLTDEIKELGRQEASILAAREAEICTNAALFARIEKVHASRAGLTEERRRVTEAVYRRFRLAGAQLGPAEQRRIREIRERIAVLSQRFIANYNAENASFEEEFGVNPKDYARAMSRTDDRAKRERMFRALASLCRRGNEFDNRAVVLEILKLRHAWARTLGYRNSAELFVEPTMAGTPEEALKLMTRIQEFANARGAKARDELQGVMDRDIAAGRLPAGTRLAKWDWAYYQAKAAREKLDFDPETIKPYLPREKVFAAAFAMAKRMYGIDVVRTKDAVSYAPGKTETYLLKDADGSLLGTLVFDYSPRPAKHLGAWIENFGYQYRDAAGREVRPIASQAGSLGENFTLVNVRTVFHEFGHALHALCSRCEDSTLSGLNGTHEYNETFSQFHQEIGVDPGYLATFAENAAGEKAPPELIARAVQSLKANLPAYHARRVGTAILDLRLHMLTDFDSLDLDAFQRSVEREIGLPPEMTLQANIPTLRHCFVHGYEAGFFAYIWSRVMSEDLLGAFRAKGDLLDPVLAAEFRRIFLERGSGRDPLGNFREFMHRDPSLTAYFDCFR